MLKSFVNALPSTFKSHQTLVLEHAALHHQVEVLARNSTRPVIRWRDHAFWDILFMIWPDWRNPILIVQPDTVFKWHKMGFRFYWRWKCRHRRPGRPKVAKETRVLIA